MQNWQWRKKPFLECSSAQMRFAFAIFFTGSTDAEIPLIEQDIN